MMTFKELREQSGMNMKQFAAHFEIPYRTVQNWEAGVNKCPEYLLKLMKFRLDQEGKEEAIIHNRLFNLPQVSDRDYQDFVDGLEDYFKEAAFDDRSVGIFGMTEGETLLANALMDFLKRNAKMD